MIGRKEAFLDIYLYFFFNFSPIKIIISSKIGFCLRDLSEFSLSFIFLIFFFHFDSDTSKVCRLFIKAIICFCFYFCSMRWCLLRELSFYFIYSIDITIQLEYKNGTILKLYLNLPVRNRFLFSLFSIFKCKRNREVNWCIV